MRKDRRSPAISLMLLTALVAACSQAPDGARPAPPPPAQTSAPEQTYAPGQPGAGNAAPGIGTDPASGPGPGPGQHPAPAAGAAADLFPAGDTSVIYQVRDHSAADYAPVQEFLLREGDRAVAVANGRAYAVWEIRPDGIWRADPKHPGTLLRYLPPQLRDGLHWSQRSGEAAIWFSLSQKRDCDMQTPICWELGVLNRGERTVFRFALSRGLISADADNWAEPTRSFRKYLDYPAEGPAPLPAADRGRLLQALAAPPAPAPIAEATAAQYADAVFTMLQTAQPALQTLRLDLNGDGRPELLQGVLGEWTTTALRFYHSDGGLIDYPVSTVAGRVRVTRLPFPDMRLPAFLVERREKQDGNGVTIVTARENPYMHTWAMEMVYGWASKSYGAPADRVRWTADGRITVEWDLGDPARHTRITEYVWTENHQQKWSGVQRTAVTYRPEGEELRYPATPKELLQAAFVVRWLGLEAELPRYFATADAAAAFASDERVSEPDYGPGWVQIGTLTDRDRTEGCGPGVQEVEPQGPGPHTFAAFWGGYEWCASVWGRVTFGADALGRPVISELLLEKGASAAP